MAKSQGVWGIDIGQCAVKALRCLPGEEPGTIVADAFDYIEYPKILSQPESNPDELIAEALQQFLSRNQVKGDRVSISVAGQSGLARFVKLPPVEVKKIPDLVRYEARNQIPFDLDEVIWDYQQMGGGMIEEMEDSELLKRAQQAVKLTQAELGRCLLNVSGPFICLVLGGHRPLNPRHRHILRALLSPQPTSEPPRRHPVLAHHEEG